MYPPLPPIFATVPVGYHLCTRIHDWKDELPHRPCLVDASGDGSKDDAAICQLGRKIDQPLHRPAKAIELPYDQHVPLASVRQRFGQASAVRLGSRCLVRESAIAACFLQRYELGRQILLRGDRKSTHLNSSHYCASRIPSSACNKTKHNT